MADKNLEQKIDALTSIVEKMDARMDKGFAAIAEDMADLATKDQIIALHTQISAIEADIRTMKQAKLETRVADLEDEVYGASKARAAR
jgi:hypothetical protein